MKEVFLTKEGLQELKDRFDYLCGVKRKEVAERIKVAREFGDLSENAEYDAAKEEQSFVESEIKDIEDKIVNAKLIEEIEGCNTVDSVSIGNTVEILDIEFKEKMEYRIVGTTEADAANNRISNESPLGKALMGRKKNEVVKVVTPSGASVEYKIILIK